MTLILFLLATFNLRVYTLLADGFIFLRLLGTCFSTTVPVATSTVVITSVAARFKKPETTTEELS